MRLLYALTSPFARKARICVLELGLEKRIEFVACAPNRLAPDPDVARFNPLGQVPTLVLDDGRSLADSVVVCLYLDALSGGRLLPAEGDSRWDALTRQSLADGVVEAVQMRRYEIALRPADKIWQDWIASNDEKIASGLAAMEAQAGHLGEAADLASIAFACALAYLDLRAADLNWRAGHPLLADWFADFSDRPSMRATSHV